MADVKAASATTTRNRIEATETTEKDEVDNKRMPVASITLCDEGEEKESELSLVVDEDDACQDDVSTSCRTTATVSDSSSSSAPSLILPLPTDDNVSV